MGVQCMVGGLSPLGIGNGTLKFMKYLQHVIVLCHMSSVVCSGVRFRVWCARGAHYDVTLVTLS